MWETADGRRPRGDCRPPPASPTPGTTWGACRLASPTGPPVRRPAPMAVLLRRLAVCLPLTTGLCPHVGDDGGGDLLVLVVELVVGAVDVDAVDEGLQEDAPQVLLRGCDQRQRRGPVHAPGPEVSNHRRSSAGQAGQVVERQQAGSGRRDRHVYDPSDSYGRATTQQKLQRHARLAATR